MRTPAFLLLALASAAAAQSNIDPAHKFSWSENCGWLNWRDANGGAQGVRINATFLQGFAWGENIGFVNFGDGTPGAGNAYTNASGADHGVNILAGGNLSGLAWGENVGWINFDTAPFVPAGQQARFDAAARRLRGYAWGENIGWLNLDHATHFVGTTGTTCYANCDNSTGSPVLTANDFQCFINQFAANAPYANCDGSTGTPTLTANDFQCFINAYAAGCS
jgi:hypothetical protein